MVRDGEFARFKYKHYRRRSKTSLFVISSDSVNLKTMAYGNKKNVSGLLLNRDEFGGPESSTRNMDMDTHETTEQPRGREDTCAKQMGRMWDDVSNNDGEIVVDVQVDPDLTRSLVASRLQYADVNYPDWADNIGSVSIRVILMVQTRAVNIQGQIHFIHLAQGDKYMRAHAGQTYLYDNGAFQLYKGVTPESLLSRCRRYAECVEGRLWAMAKRCKSRSEKDILDASNRTYRAISALEGRNIRVASSRTIATWPIRLLQGGRNAPGSGWNQTPLDIPPRSILSQRKSPHVAKIINA